MNFEEMVQRAVNAKAKAVLRSSTMVWELNVCYFKNYCPSNNIAAKMQTQKTTIKDFHLEEAKTKNLKPISSSINAAEPLEQEKKDQKDKKKKFQ